MATCTTETRGGCSFDQLCRGGCRYYVCDRGYLVHITQLDTLEKAEDKLVENIENIFQDLQTQREKKITKFYIGKTFVQANQKYPKLNPLNPGSWRKGGISSRWNDHRKEEYGRDGMIVIAVITRDQVPTTAASKVKQELYTLALEQRLLHYYQITKGDERLHNETFTSGGTDKKGSAGYALYVAFSLSEDEEEIHLSTNTQDRCTSTDDVVFVKYSPPPPSPPKRRKTNNKKTKTT